MKLYINNDISKYSDVSFNNIELKKIINNNNKYHQSFINELIKQILEILKDYINIYSVTESNIKECFTKKFKDCD